MKKRWLVYGIVSIATLLLTLIFKRQDLDYISVFYSPWIGIVTLLRTMSYASDFMNVLAWILFFIVVALPMIIGVVMLKKQTTWFDLGSLFVIASVLGIILYRSLNLSEFPEWEERIALLLSSGVDIRPYLQIGLFNFWLGMLLFYLVVKGFIVKQSLGKNVSYAMGFLVSFMLMMFIHVWVSASYLRHTPVQKLQTTQQVFDVILGIGVIALIELMIIFVEHVKENNFREKLVQLTSVIKVLSVIILLTSILKVISLNMYQIMHFEELNDLNFSFDIDVLSWILVFFFYGLYHYLVIANDVMEEAELTI